MMASNLKLARQFPLHIPLISAILFVSRFQKSETSVNGLTSRSFRGHDNIQEIQCTGEVLPLNSDLFSMVLYEASNDQLIAYANVGKPVCTTEKSFSMCVVDRKESRKSNLRVLIADLNEGQSAVYGCNLTYVVPGGRSKIISWFLEITRIKTTTTTTESTTTTTTTTTTPEPPTKAPVASGVKSKFEDFQLPISVIIIGLVLLIFFATLCLILVVMQCKGRRRRRSRAANRESLLSTKNEPMGGGYRNPRNMMVPGQMPPEAVGPNFAMRYQKSIPDTGYVSGSSVYYSEPYGTLDDEMKERLKPNPRLCHIPYDIKGGPLDTQGQEHHSA